MRFLVPLLLLTSLATACKPPRLARRLPGTWTIEHYDEYAVRTGTSTGHTLDGAGTLSLAKGGRADLRFRDGRAHGSLAACAGCRWQLRDSLLTLTDAGGRVQAPWLLTSDLQYLLELVSVNAARDTVRTMYLKK